MIFKPEMVEKILAGEKTVTRRPVRNERIEAWGSFGELVSVTRICSYKVGRDYAVQPGRGKKAVGRIQILRVTRRPLGHQLTIIEAAKEGFAGFRAFRDYWEQLYGAESYDPTQLVDRIEFELVPLTVKGSAYTGAPA